MRRTPDNNPPRVGIIVTPAELRRFGKQDGAPWKFVAVLLAVAFGLAALGLVVFRLVAGDWPKAEFVSLLCLAFTLGLGVGFAVSLLATRKANRLIEVIHARFNTAIKEEREACAKLAQTFSPPPQAADLPEALAQAIRARSKNLDVDLDLSPPRGVSRSRALMVLWVTVLAVVGCLLCPPWTHVRRDGNVRIGEPVGYRFLFVPPPTSRSSVEIDGMRLTIQLVIVVAVGAGAFVTVTFFRAPARGS